MAQCPFCDATIKNEILGCQNCGYNRKYDIGVTAWEANGNYFESNKQGISPNGQFYGNNQGLQQGYANLPEQEISRGTKRGIIVLTLIEPIYGGVIIAIYLLASKNENHKKFGRTLLTVAIVWAVLSVIVMDLAYSGLIYMGTTF